MNPAKDLLDRLANAPKMEPPIPSPTGTWTHLNGWGWVVKLHRIVEPETDVWVRRRDGTMDEAVVQTLIHRVAGGVLHSVWGYSNTSIRHVEVRLMGSDDLDLMGRIYRHLRIQFPNAEVDIFEGCSDRGVLADGKESSEAEMRVHQAKRGYEPNPT
jgi:hypothetical protein